MLSQADCYQYLKSQKGDKHNNILHFFLTEYSSQLYWLYQLGLNDRALPDKIVVGNLQLDGWHGGNSAVGVISSTTLLMVLVQSEEDVPLESCIDRSSWWCAPIRGSSVAVWTDWLPVLSLPCKLIPVVLRSAVKKKERDQLASVS